VPTLRRRLLTLLALATLAAALPAPAVHAQGAGDEQYQDPFDGSQTDDEAPARTTPAPPPAATPAPAPAASAPTSTTAQSAPAAPAAPAAELPRTGFDTRAAALAALGLLLLGLVLRRRTGPESR
jgi:LPXTG-motif cell wall-anchored protein